MSGYDTEWLHTETERMAKRLQPPAISILMDRVEVLEEMHETLYARVKRLEKRVQPTET